MIWNPVDPVNPVSSPAPSTTDTRFRHTQKADGMNGMRRVQIVTAGMKSLTVRFQTES